MDLTGYQEYLYNVDGWKSYFKCVGTRIATYEPMNCRQLEHNTMREALLFLQNEGYTHMTEHLEPNNENMQEFREI